MIAEPCFDSEKLNEHGFNDTLNDFTGTRFNKAVIGWAGNKRNAYDDLIFWAVGYVSIGVSNVVLG